MTKPAIVVSMLLAACPSEKDLRVGTPCPAAVIQEVNDHWIAEHEDPGDNKWARAVYFTGDVAAYLALGDDAYLDYARRWAEENEWSIHDGTRTRHADDHAAGQVYLALHAIDPDPTRIRELVTTIDQTVYSRERDDWSWIDAMYMASPVFAELGELTGNPRYHETMFELYRDARDRRGLYETDAGLWYRDESYLYPEHRTEGGEKIFWSRGNGWVIASIVRTLEHLPADAPMRAEYVEMLRTMAAALRDRQRYDGFWNVSLDDPGDHGGPESSGTALFTYALAWGIAHGELDRATYEPVVELAWHALVEGALLADGTVGWVQGVGEEPGSAQPVTLDSNEDFGVGALLLAASEVAALDADWGCAP